MGAFFLEKKMLSNKARLERGVHTVARKLVDEALRRFESAEPFDDRDRLGALHTLCGMTGALETICNRFGLRPLSDTFER
jgi:hypothetical protein